MKSYWYFINPFCLGFEIDIWFVVNNKILKNFYTKASGNLFLVFKNIYIISVNLGFNIHVRIPLNQNQENQSGTLCYVVELSNLFCNIVHLYSGCKRGSEGCIELSQQDDSFSPLNGEVSPFTLIVITNILFHISLPLRCHQL